jgi:site-specific DNA-methyltransferase (adenine-specific)/adenine-specific DNA-methyltransferase
MPTINWIGKEAVVNHHQQVPFHLLEDVPALSCGQPGEGNLIVQGDNLVALKALLPYYAGQVKCIYIDPPYNTGNEGWVYNDNVNSPVIREWLGKVVGKEEETLDRHDRWLCMMYPRLTLLHQLLHEEGSIFISIDDTELFWLKAVMDEIFGSLNFRACITWQRKYSVSNNFKGIATIVDYLLVYSKTDRFQNNLLPRSEESIARYSNPDNDPRGPWKAVDYLNQATPEKRPNLCYNIINPNTGDIITNTKKAWKYEPEVHQRHILENRLWWGAKGTNKVPALKLFLSEVRQGLTPHNWWSHEETGHTDEAKKEIDRILGANAFDTPKPTRLIERILQIATNPGDLILDSFAGSGTTGHAILKLNQATPDKEPRRFILVEMEPNIARNITAERVRRVAEGYTNAKGMHIEGLGGCFRYCELGEPMFDEDGRIRETVSFTELARHVYFTELGEPMTCECVTKSPLLGTCRGVGIYLLYNGILSDKSANGGNVLTRAVLAQLPPFDGPKVIYCTSALLGQDRLQAERITVRQIPYEIKVS